MKDEHIVELYWQRSEKAIQASEEKYGKYCYAVANNILHNRSDAEECVNSTWLCAWNSMPPQKPSVLQMFFAKIARQLSFNKRKAETAQKRGGGELPLTLDELEDCIADSANVEKQIESRELASSMDRFLGTLSARERNIFLRRYFFVESTETIAKRYALRESNVLMILSRTRQKLKAHLTKEGYFYE